MSTVVVFTDGGARGNPGLAGCGAYFEYPDGHTARLKERHLHLTNNQAEYHALIMALEEAVAQKIPHLHVKADSQLMVRQMQCRYAVHSQELVPLWRRAQELSRQLNKVTYEHIRREFNKEADRLANQAMDGL